MTKKRRLDSVDYDLFRQLPVQHRRQIAQYYIHGRWLPEVGYWQHRAGFDQCMRVIRSIKNKIRLFENDPWPCLLAGDYHDLRQRQFSCYRWDLHQYGYLKRYTGGP